MRDAEAGWGAAPQQEEIIFDLAFAFMDAAQAVSQPMAPQFARDEWHNAYGAVQAATVLTDDLTPIFDAVFIQALAQNSPAARLNAQRLTGTILADAAAGHIRGAVPLDVVQDCILAAIDTCQHGAIDKATRGVASHNLGLISAVADRPPPISALANLPYATLEARIAEEYAAPCAEETAAARAELLKKRGRLAAAASLSPNLYPILAVANNAAAAEAAAIRLGAQKIIAVVLATRDAIAGTCSLLPVETIDTLIATGAQDTNRGVLNLAQANAAVLKQLQNPAPAFAPQTSLGGNALPKRGLQNG
jgi:hypothetical protein